MMTKVEHKHHTDNVIVAWRHTYKSFIRRRTGSHPTNQPLSMDDWRSTLFTNFIIYLLPSCMIALVPGVYMSLVHGFWMIAVFDLLTLIAIIFISLSKGLSQHLKKILVILVLYGLSVMLLLNLSLLGPGLVYLLTMSVVVTLTCKMRLAYYSVAINLAVCLACAALIHYRPFGTLLATDYSVGIWLTVSSNLVFLSSIIVVLIGKTIQGLEKTILLEQQLKDDLYHMNLALSKTNERLTESEGHYKTLFFQNPTPMWVLDIHTLGFLQINRAAIQKYGYSKQEFLQMNLTHIKAKFSAAKVRRIIAKAKKSGVPQTLYTPHLKKDGSMLQVEIVFNSLNFNGRPAILAICNDLSERMAYLNSINLQQQKLQQIAWIQSHQARAPLASILGLVQLYDTELPQEQISELIQKISDSAEKLDNVIKETVRKSEQ